MSTPPPASDTPDPAVPPGTPAERVRPLELFFDLVFVFTITQIASVLGGDPTGRGLARSLVLLAVTWWMYGGYAWLTNSLDLDRTRPRLLLLTGTGAFFLMSVAVPRTFEDGPWALLFGLAYLAVVLVHTLGFLTTSGRAGIIRLGPLNLLAALIVVAAGLVPPDTRGWVLAAAALLEVVSPFLAGIGGFTVGVGHFVERHGLAVLILLGESIAEVGAAAGHESEAATVVLGSLLALALSAALWWLYFDREDRDSEALLEAVPPELRGRTSLFSYGYAYLVLIFGIAVAAVGMEECVSRFDAALHGTEALLLPLGLSLFLLGVACFHRVLSRSWPLLRVLAAAVVWTVLPAARVAGWSALALATVLVVALAAAEGRGRPERGEVARASQAGSTPA